MMREPLVSVVIPTYNRAETVSRAIDSALEQSYRNIEVIVVDDGSTDDTPAVIEGYDDERLTYLRQDNHGAPHARNVGIEHANGDYVSFLDSDDEYLPGRLERTVSVLCDEPDDCVGVFHSYRRVRPGYPVRTVSAPSERVGLDDLAVRNVVGVLSCTVFEREPLAEVGGFDESLPASQDYDLYLRLAEHYRLRGIDDVLVRRYLRDDSITQDIDRKIAGHERIEEKHGNILTDYRKSRHNYARFFLYAERGEFGAARAELRTAIRRYPALRYVYHYLFSFGGQRGMWASHELKARLRQYL